MLFLAGRDLSQLIVATLGHRHPSHLFKCSQPTSSTVSQQSEFINPRSVPMSKKIFVNIVVTDNDKHEETARLHRPRHRPLLLLEHPQVHGGRCHKNEETQKFVCMRGTVSLYDCQYLSGHPLVLSRLSSL